MIRYDYLLHYITELPSHLRRLRLDMIFRGGVNCLTGARLQASAEMLTAALFWGVTQHKLVISYGCFGTTYRPRL